MRSASLADNHLVVPTDIVAGYLCLRAPVLAPKGMSLQIDEAGSSWSKRKCERCALVCLLWLVCGSMGAAVAG